MKDKILGPRNPARPILLIARVVFIGIVLCIPLIAGVAAYSASAASSSPALAGSLSVPAGLLSPDYFGPKIDDIAWYQPQTTCNNTDKVGVVAYQQLILKAFPQTGDYGISTPCDGTVSEHHEGRAWDWKVSVNNASDVQNVKTVLDWLFAKDKYGNSYAMARRLGIMYIIWNHQFWALYNARLGWQAYTGDNPHTDHVHFSFYWTGALQQTTYWHPEKSCTSTATSTATSACGDPLSANTPTPSPSPSPTSSTITPTPTSSGERKSPSPSAPLILIPEHMTQALRQ
jgi:hypothetical protein